MTSGCCTSALMILVCTAVFARISKNAPIDAEACKADPVQAIPRADKFLHRLDTVASERSSADATTDHVTRGETWSALAISISTRSTVSRVISHEYIKY